ncbi:hypothetical protein FIBSPDRAFT_860774 [Athelia psychrophila]|uniref:Uncharacterized protein n=1 Tax=Athelia psychrophila TaxID=1759441 RepID=A0A166JY04_9AGAM|nr:hypothetical protein FIBSPDRAFT_860774 [Fibularhizoctonia sp. CBS 109695]
MTSTFHSFSIDLNAVIASSENLQARLGRCHKHVWYTRVAWIPPMHDYGTDRDHGDIRSILLVDIEPKLRDLQPAGVHFMRAWSPVKR